MEFALEREVLLLVGVMIERLEVLKFSPKPVQSSLASLQRSVRKSEGGLSNFDQVIRIEDGPLAL
jgi:hypothetical protein